MTLQSWNADPDLACVRDHDALARLPDPERKDWQALWSNVAELLRRARGYKISSPAPPSLEFPADPFAPGPNKIQVQNTTGTKSV